MGRVHGRKSRSARTGTNNCLDKAQEQALASWIGILDDTNTPSTPQDIEGYANEILARGGSDRRVGKNWAYNFIKRFPNDYSHTVQKPMEVGRMGAEKLPIIIDWFHRLEVALMHFKIGPKNIYNFDESGFQLGQGKCLRVVTKHRRSTKSFSTGGIGETVTGVECIAADGWVMPPFILFQGSYHLENWYREQPDLPDNYIVATSSTGWNNEVRVVRVDKAYTSEIYLLLLGARTSMAPRFRRAYQRPSSTAWGLPTSLHG